LTSKQKCNIIVIVRSEYILDAVDKDLIEFAELYGIEVTDGKESVIIMEDGYYHHYTNLNVCECGQKLKWD